MKGAKVNYDYNWSHGFVGTSQTDNCELTLRAALERRHVPTASCTFSPPGPALCLRGNKKYDITAVLFAAGCYAAVHAFSKAGNIVSSNVPTIQVAVPFYSSMPGTVHAGC